jgi:hypothetical protein
MLSVGHESKQFEFEVKLRCLEKVVFLCKSLPEVVFESHSKLRVIGDHYSQNSGEVQFCIS